MGENADSTSDTHNATISPGDRLVTLDESAKLRAIADAAFREERQKALKTLIGRWVDLGLTRSQVKMILAKRGLPPALADSRDADWSTVDLAVIQDMITEAGA